MAREQNSPCKGCENHTAECHAVCMAYFVWKILDMGYSEKERQERNKYRECDSFRIDQYQKVKKESRRK